ncbi:four-carbon acid sugar kinase family protein [Roseobacter sp. HKCCD7870]|uniref:four-carbon acid sugar kinase family protein n=1 Tax=Roseobacter sp. HKCCD7870 TaxID=3120343 RepID=UPI0030EEC0FF
MSNKLVIIADDLSGALDTAAPFSSAPGGVVVFTKPKAMRNIINESVLKADVIAISTRSREMSAEAARAAVDNLLKYVPKGVRIFKKIDSRMKGNIEAELDPLKGDMLVVPAVPEFGRVVCEGQVQGFGVPKPISIAERLGSHAANSLIPDTKTCEDIAFALRSVDHRLMVGARGLALALAAQMGLDETRLPIKLDRPLVILVGSTDKITLNQVTKLREACPSLRYVAAYLGEIPNVDDEIANLTLVQSLHGPKQLMLEDASKQFAKAAVSWIKDAPSILCTGGATAEAMLDVMGIECLHLLGEALPGLPVARADNRLIVTKSGGFGAPDCFLHL